MPRTLLRERSVNEQKRHEYSPYTRGKVVGAVEAGESMAAVLDVQIDLNLPSKALYATTYNTTKGRVGTVLAV